MDACALARWRHAAACQASPEQNRGCGRKNKTEAVHNLGVLRDHTGLPRLTAPGCASAGRHPGVSQIPGGKKLQRRVALRLLSIGPSPPQ